MSQLWNDNQLEEQEGGRLADDCQRGSKRTKDVHILVAHDEASEEDLESSIERTM